MDTSDPNARALNDDWSGFKPQFAEMLQEAGWWESYPDQKMWTHERGASLKLDGAAILITDKVGHIYTTPAAVDAPLLWIIVNTVSGETARQMRAEAQR